MSACPGLLANKEKERERTSQTLIDERRVHGESGDTTSLLKRGCIEAIQQALPHAFGLEYAFVSSIEASTSLLSGNKFVVFGKHMFRVLISHS